LGLADVVALALAIGTDCFSVCLGLAMEPGGPRRTLLVSAAFGGMQALLVALGYLTALGMHWLLHTAEVRYALLSRLPIRVRPEALHEELHWVLSSLGATALMAVGVGLISDFLAGERPKAARPLRSAFGLALVSVMVNVDAFTAGIGLGMLDGVLLPHVLAVMAVVGGSLSRLGFEAGSKFGGILGKIAQPIGGILIILVALKVIAGLVLT